MMKQLRNQLLPLDFNQCIMLFSNLPEIDIDLCLEDAMAMLRITPGSVAVSKFDDADASTTATNGGSAGNGGGSGLDLDFIVAPAPPPVVADETAADRWWEVRPPLDELRAEITPRISLHDMLSESQRDGGAVVFDVRPKEQFQAVRFPGSFHFNIAQARRRRSGESGARRAAARSSSCRVAATMAIDSPASWCRWAFHM
jgi:hypothetical protein